MAWPSPPDYNEAVQNPQLCFADPELRGGKTAVNALGLPWPRSGNNADVYKVIAANGKAWAVKCFTREVHGLHERYQAVSDHLSQAMLPFMVRFQYLDQGILVHGQWYPAVKMRWVEGQTLNDLIKELIDRPQVLDRLAQLWLRLAPEMRAAQIVHGDLQHGNVLLVPHKKLAKMRLRLIDYDGMTVPALAQRPSGELGHPNYQHPQRLRDGSYDAETDRFAHLVIYTALRCLVHSGKALWERYDNGDNLLFKEKDFREPSESALFRELLDQKEPVSRSLAGHLLLASQGPRERVPLLYELAPNGTVPLLSTAERDRVQAIMGGPAPTASVSSEAEPPGPPRRGLRAALWGSASARVRGAGAVVAGAVYGVVVRGRDRWLGSRRSLWVASTALVGLGLLAIVAGLLAKTLAARDVSGGLDSVIVPEAGTPRLAPIAALRLQVGDNRRNVDVDRKGYAGPLVLQVDGLPAGVRCMPVVVPAFRSSAVLELKADLEAVEDLKTITIAVRVGDQVVSQESAALIVEKPALGSLSFAPNEIVLQAGEKQTIRVVVQRQEYQGPIELNLYGLPVGIRGSTAVIDARQTEGRLELVAEADVRYWADRITGTARVGTHEIGKWRMPATIQRPTGLRLLPILPVTVRSGARQSIKITVERQGYEGPIDVRLTGLPKGATCKPVTLNDTDTDASLEVAIGPEAPAMQTLLTATLTIGQQVFAAQDVALKVEKPEPTSLGEKVRFSTCDGVQLVGTWFASERGKAAPCVLLLHNLGSRRQQESWERLAAAFQQKGYAVLSFDFRGHGDSAKVDANFWQQPHNKRVVRLPSRDPFDKNVDTIRQENFPQAYLPVLANDIAAALSLLDRLNDEGKCNSANLTLVGVGEGATLGALWLCSECSRYQVTSIKPARLAAIPEGKRVACAVWLNISPALGGAAVPLADWIRLAGRAWKVPMTFVRGADDTAAANVIRPFLQEFRPAPLTETAVPRTKLAGHDLLTPKVMTQEMILAYVENVPKDRSNVPWVEQDNEHKIFYWMVPPTNNLLVAKQRGDKVMHPLPLSALGIR